ncbi:MAG: hypothetical protein OXF68_15785 [Gammaproteobacteria bacterium]|nr:hypothetical protein [Gammaproteobacteria bacterium]
MAIHIDTAEAINDLRAANLSEQQATAIVRVVVKAQDGLVTKDYLDARLATQTTQLVVTAVSVAAVAIAVAKWVL